jgi:hypothetical protein
MKIRPVGVEFLHVDEQTDMKPVVAFRNLANAPKKTVRCAHTVILCVGYDPYKKQFTWTALTDWSLQRWHGIFMWGNFDF